VTYRALVQAVVDDCLEPFEALLRGAVKHGRETISCAAIRAVVDTIRPRLSDLADAPPVCSGCNKPMMPARWRCSQCGTFALELLRTVGDEVPLNAPAPTDAPHDVV
jgi:hypothetical protein